MKTESLVRHYEVMSIQQMHIDDFVLEFLENKAELTDKEVSQKLFKELIGKYAEAERELVRLNEVKNRFLGIAAHDLRNPLSAIRGFSELLKDGDMGVLSDEQHEFISRIYDASNSMLGLVNDLLDVSVIQSGKFNLKVSNTPLDELVKERIVLSAAAAEKKEISIDAELARVNATVDGEKIKQVVDNYLTNALKFSPKGSSIDVLLEEEEGTARLSIRDEGAGIPPGEISKLFGEFNELSTRPTDGEKSTGLGLSIVKKIIETHGGSVACESKVGRGSIFSFTIPLEAKNE